MGSIVGRPGIPFRLNQLLRVAPLIVTLSSLKLYILARLWSLFQISENSAKISLLWVNKFRPKLTSYHLTSRKSSLWAIAYGHFETFFKTDIIWQLDIIKRRNYWPSTDLKILQACLKFFRILLRHNFHLTSSIISILIYQNKYFNPSAWIHPMDDPIINTKGIINHFLTCKRVQYRTLPSQISNILTTSSLNWSCTVWLLLNVSFQGIFRPGFGVSI